MRIIHYIDGIEAGKLLSDHFLRLATAQQEYAEVRIVTHRDDFKRVSVLSYCRPTGDLTGIHAWQNGNSRST